MRNIKILFEVEIVIKRTRCFGSITLPSFTEVEWRRKIREAVEVMERSASLNRDNETTSPIYRSACPREILHSLARVRGRTSHSTLVNQGSVMLPKRLVRLIIFRLGKSIFILLIIIIIIIVCLLGEKLLSSVSSKFYK